MSAVGDQRQAANILTNAQAQASSLAHILQTNDPPTDLELKQISPLLGVIESALARFTPRDLDPMFKATTYDPLKSLHAALRGAASPLRRIPSEIISQIFAECMSGNLDDDGGTTWNTLDVTEAPWTLGRVSRRWREIALGDQKLWSCIRVDSWALAIAGKPEPTIAELLVCLARSGEHPLSIHFTDRYPSTFGSKALLIHLFAYAERWTYLKLVVSFKYLELTTPLKGRLPQLQKLVLEVDGPNISQVVDTFEVAPNLRTASTILDEYEPPSGTMLVVSDVPYAVKLPWGQLTSLDVDSPEVIKHAPQLLKCRLLVSLFPQFLTGSVIQHMSMRTLVTNYAYMLNRLETPSLESLHIFGDGEPYVLGQITAFLSRSSCSLKTLILDNTTIESESDLRSLLQHAPGLLHLEVNNGLVVWNIMARVLTISAQSRLVPCLAKIVFSMEKKLSYQHDIDAEPVLRMLESRRNLNMSDDEDIKQLESVALLATPPRLLAQLTPRLLTLKNLGLKIRHEN